MYLHAQIIAANQILQNFENYARSDIWMLLHILYKFSILSSVLFSFSDVGLAQILAEVVEEVRLSIDRDINGADLLYGLLSAPWLYSLLRVRHAHSVHQWLSSFPISSSDIIPGRSLDQIILHVKDLSFPIGIRVSGAAQSRCPKTIHALFLKTISGGQCLPFITDFALDRYFIEMWKSMILQLPSSHKTFDNFFAKPLIWTLQYIKVSKAIHEGE